MAEQLWGTILCAAEVEADRHALGCTLREAGFQVREAATGGEVVQAAWEPPDLVLLAGSPDDPSCFEVCRQLKSDPGTTAIPVLLLLPGPLTVQDRGLALESGASDCLGRPVEATELIRRVQAAQEARRQGLVWRQRSGLTKAAAERLLDWLENNGYLPTESAHVEGRGFVIRWQERPTTAQPPRGSLLQALKRVLFGMCRRGGEGPG
jgi:DNA-binding response OmpR family regulator